MVQTIILHGMCTLYIKVNSICQSAKSVCFGFCNAAYFIVADMYPLKKIFIIFKHTLFYVATIKEESDYDINYGLA